ncbi:DsbA family protein [Glaciimonas soli]|uniref:DsbA family protein n=1 Tax=Glaciimonas soli TaxID=2590999 RepID=UPI00188576CC|nr:DsbA family protein [Glaciimonas soli]
MTTLHYIFDPLCGWCYGAEPLISAARTIPGLTIALHSGGMMAGANRHAVTSQLRDYVMGHDKRIAQMTGQPFGDGYFNGLLRDTSAILDSAPPTTAILAAEELAGKGLDMLHRLQRAHYVEGRRIAETTVLFELAKELEINAAAFAEAFDRLSGAPTVQHFNESRIRLTQAGGQGYPTLVLERADGTLERLDISGWLGRAAEWTDHLRLRTADKTHAEAASDGAFCGIDGC